MLAAKDNYSKIINLLVSHGAEINVQDSNGYTVCYSTVVIAGPFSWNVFHLDDPFIHLTLHMISKVSIFCQALAIAAQYGREEAVLKLLQLGADKTIRTKAGKNPADLAVIFKHPQVPGVLL